MMNKYLTIFESHSQYVNPDIKPNVSYCVYENEVHYNQKTISIKIASSGYSTLSSLYALDLSNLPLGLSAKYVKGHTYGMPTVNFTNVDCPVAAGTGLIINGTPGETYEIPISSSGGRVLTDNQLVATVTALVIDPTTDYYNAYYVLSSGRFNIVDSSGTSAAGKCFLKVPKYVDLGLPSGTLWAATNIGADRITKIGLYFQWGDTQGYTTEQVGVDKQFSVNDYKFGGSPYEKYDTDGLTQLESTDDAATVNMNGNWHIPTKLQMLELLSNTTSQWVTNYNNSGVNGELFTAANGNSIFLPASGSCLNGVIYDVDVYGNYWTSSLDTSAHYNAAIMYFYSTLPGVTNGTRYNGLSIRGVVDSLNNN